MTEEEAKALAAIMKEMEDAGKLVPWLLSFGEFQIALWELFNKEIMERIDEDKSARQQVEMELYEGEVIEDPDIDGGLLG